MADQKRFSRNSPGSPAVSRWFAAFLVVTAIVWLPFVSLILSLSIASLVGCEVNEGVTRACLVAGVDIGDLLQVMMVMGWFAIALLPFMLLTLLIAFGWGLVVLYRRLRRP